MKSKLPSTLFALSFLMNACGSSGSDSSTTTSASSTKPISSAAAAGKSGVLAQKNAPGSHPTFDLNCNFKTEERNASSGQIYQTVENQSFTLGSGNKTYTLLPNAIASGMNLRGSVSTTPESNEALYGKHYELFTSLGKTNNTLPRITIQASESASVETRIDNQDGTALEGACNPKITPSPASLVSSYQITCSGTQTSGRSLKTFSTHALVNLSTTPADMPLYTDVHPQDQDQWVLRLSTQTQDSTQNIAELVVENEVNSQVNENNHDAWNARVVLPASAHTHHFTFKIEYPEPSARHQPMLKREFQVSCVTEVPQP